MSHLDDEFYKYIGIKIKEARRLKNYSLEDVGRRVGKTKKPYKDMKKMKFVLMVKFLWISVICLIWITPRF